MVIDVIYASPCVNVFIHTYSISQNMINSQLYRSFIDTYRYFNPDKEGVYSWWSYRFKAREKNAGWRIDYFCTSKALESNLVSADIHTEVLGSDHCPIELVVEI